MLGFEVKDMLKKKDTIDQQLTNEPQSLQIYASLPPPANNEQFNELLKMISEDRKRVFYYAWYAKGLSFLRSIIALSIIAYIFYTTGEPSHTLKELLKYLIPFIK